jgi:dihydrofolate synthase/folylpolyglutamate synthase
VVVARQDRDVERVLRARAAGVDARVVAADRDFAVISRTPDEHGQIVAVHGLFGRYEDLRLSLRGRHQAQNAAVAIATVEAVRGGPIHQETVRAALRRVTAPGRFDVRPGTPSLVLDVAHNPHGAGSLVAALAELGPAWTIGVVAVMKDKDHEGLLRRLEPAIDVVVCTRNSSSRCLPAADLAACARTVFGASRVHAARDVPAALAVAAELARRRGFRTGDVRILVTGSVVTVGDVPQ